MIGQRVLGFGQPGLPRHDRLVRLMLRLLIAAGLRLGELALQLMAERICSTGPRLAPQWAGRSPGQPVAVVLAVTDYGTCGVWPAPGYPGAGPLDRASISCAG
jgi:hypothetical protein